MDDKTYLMPYIDCDPLIDELNRAVAKHGFTQTPMSVNMTEEEAFLITSEEAGEVMELTHENDPMNKAIGIAIGRIARHATYDCGDQSKLKAEYLQLAAMSYARYLAL